MSEHKPPMTLKEIMDAESSGPYTTFDVLRVASREEIAAKAVELADRFANRKEMSESGTLHMPPVTRQEMRTVINALRAYAEAMRGPLVAFCPVSTTGCLEDPICVGACKKQP